MRPTIRLGRIAGIEVGIHWSLLVIGVLLVGSLAGGELPALAPHAHGSYLAAAVLAVAALLRVDPRPRARALDRRAPPGPDRRRHHAVAARRRVEARLGVRRARATSSASRSPGPATTLALAAVFGVLAVAFDAVVAPGTLLPTVAGVARGREPHPRRLQPAARRAARRRARARRDALEAQRRPPPLADLRGARRTRASARLLVAGSLALRVRRLRLLHHRARRLLRAQRVAPGRELARACCARSTTARVGELMRPVAQHRPRLDHRRRRSARSPSRRCSSGGTAPRPRCSPPARSSPSHPRRASTCSSARSALPLAQLAARADRRAGDRRRDRAACPAIVDDADGHAIGVFGLDELKIAAPTRSGARASAR